MLEKLLDNVAKFFHLPDDWIYKRDYFYVLIRSAIASVLQENGYSQKQVAEILKKTPSTISTTALRHNDVEYLDVRNAVYEVYLRTVLEDVEESVINYLHILSSIKRRVESDEADPIIKSGKHIENAKMSVAQEAIKFTLKNLGANSDLLCGPIFKKFKLEYYE